MTRYRHFGCGRSLRPERRSGFALILVLVAIAMVSLAAYTMTDRLVVENESAQLYGQQLQARMAVDSGVSHVLFLLEQPVPTRLEWGGVYDNPTMFQAQLVVDHLEPRGRVRFGVVAPRLDAQGLSNGWRWGLEDESARININALEMQETVGAAAGAIADAAMGALPQAIAGGGGVPVGNTQGGPQGGSQPSGGNRSGGGGAAGGANTQAPTGQPQPTAPNAQGNSNGNAPRPGDSNGAQGGGSSGAAPSGAGAPSDSSNAGDSSTEDAVEAIDTSGRTLLMKLPGMTEDVADAILDWIDADDEPREFGAEIDFYSSMQPAYAPRNGPLETIEELLLVRGVTPDLLFGRDVNRNGMLDVAEQSLPSSSADDGTGAMDLGWASMLTVYSQERNVNQQGQRRIDLNGVSDMQQLYDDLVAAGMDESWATFIVAYRQRGPYQGTSTQTVTASNVQLDMTQQGTNELTQVLDLIDAKVEIPAQNGGQASVMESPFSSGLGAMSSYMSKLMDLCTVRPEKVFAGRVNINQASRTVLLTVPGITPEIAESIINQRDMQGAENAAEMANETWILARGIVTLAEMRQIQPFITARGDVYRGQVVGYYDSGEIASRVEVIFDASSAVPRLLSWRDISHLGRGFARETLGVSGMSVSGNTDGLGSGSSLSSGR